MRVLANHDVHSVFNMSAYRIARRLVSLGVSGWQIDSLAHDLIRIYHRLIAFRMACCARRRRLLAFSVRPGASRDAADLVVMCSQVVDAAYCLVEDADYGVSRERERELSFTSASFWSPIMSEDVRLSIVVFFGH